MYLRSNAVRINRASASIAYLTLTLTGLVLVLTDRTLIAAKLLLLALILARLTKQTECAWVCVVVILAEVAPGAARDTHSRVSPLNARHAHCSGAAVVVVLTSRARGARRSLDRRVLSRHT